MEKVENRKILNLIFHEGDYFIHEPYGDKKIPKDPDLIIDKHLWNVLRFKPHQTT